MPRSNPPPEHPGLFAIRPLCLLRKIRLEGREQVLEFIVRCSDRGLRIRKVHAQDGLAALDQSLELRSPVVLFPGSERFPRSFLKAGSTHPHPRPSAAIDDGFAEYVEHARWLFRSIHSFESVVSS